MPVNTNYLKVGERLYPPNDCLISSSGQYRLIYNGGGNLVLYDTAAGVAFPGEPYWSSGTAGRTCGYVELRQEGNLVVVDQGGIEVYTTPTNLPYWRGTYLKLQDDGNLVLYGVAPVFQSFTDPRNPSQYPPFAGGAPPNANGVNVQSITQDVATLLWDIVVDFL